MPVDPRPSTELATADVQICQSGVASSQGGPLAGITVVDLSTVGPAARCSRALADYGAAVIKVGAPAAVQIEPAAYAYGGGRGMTKVRLDLKSDQGRAEFLRLAASADVVLESFRPGVVDRLGIGCEAVASVNPAIVYCSTSGYGQTGPRSQWAGHDINYLAVGGFLASSGRTADGTPALPGATVADIAAGGMQAAMSIMAALVHRERSGEGAYLDVSVADGVLWMLSLSVDEHLALGTSPGPGHDILTGRYACYGVYQCADGRFVAVGAIEPAFWANLCRELGLDQWIDHQTDDAAQPQVRADLTATFATKPRDEWTARLGPANTCVAPVLAVDELPADEQFLARGALITHNELRQVGPVLAT